MSQAKALCAFERKGNTTLRNACISKCRVSLSSESAIALSFGECATQSMRLHAMCVVERSEFGECATQSMRLHAM